MVADVNSWYLKIHKRIVWDKIHNCQQQTEIIVVPREVFISSFCTTPPVQVINRLNLKLGTPVSCIHNAFFNTQ
jgi:hypothetical protein